MMLEVPGKYAELLLDGPKRIHLIGVAGSGMSGIAGLLLSLGHQVSGCDRVSTLETHRLETLGLKFHLPQTADAVHGAEFVIYSSAIKPGNPAFDEAVRLRFPMIRRADALAAIMSGKRGIVVAGMHGKTTTSAMAAHVLRVGGLRPSHYVGAEIPILGTNAHWDMAGEYFVAEGDESDGTLKNYWPEHTVILNIEEEHLDFYPDLAAIIAVFDQLVAQTRGKVIYCIDDRYAARLCHRLTNAISYGMADSADYQFRNVISTELGSRFEVWKHGALLGETQLEVPGLHNVSNAIAVIGLANELGIAFPSIVKALGSFRGARRRFEIKLRSPEVMVVDDYGHHPTEIKATLSTARATGYRRVIVMFQPHRYTRTHALRNEFGSAFADADLVYVTDVYAASEEPIDGVSGETIVAAIKRNAHPGVFYFPQRPKLHQEIARIVRPGDLLLSLGAGDIHEEASKLVQDLEVARKLREAMGAGELSLYEPLAKHTTLRVGGPAQFWLEPETRGGLANLLAYCSANRTSVMLIGRGSNLLVRDEGIPGVVIHLSRGDFIALEVKAGIIHAGAGVRLKQLSAVARNSGLGGFEWMEGIPGSVGGSLRMNAGAMGYEAFNQVVSVQVVNLRGEFEVLTPAEMEVHYRSVPTLRNCVAVSAAFRGYPSTIKEIDQRLEKSMHKRKTSQPIASSAGCIFKNPAECPAGKLVEELGMKGRAVGAARVSEIHGNFIVNDGGARAKDILQLIAEIQTSAKTVRGIELKTEVEIVGVDDE
jgi:UDP-N-acetylmuramate--alanine ligase